MSTTHELEPVLFNALAGGDGGVPAIEALRAAQLSRHLVLIRQLLHGWPGPAAEREATIDALDAARERAPERFAEVLGAPLIGGWLAIANRAAARGVASYADFAHLNAVAMVACAAAGVAARADVPVRDGVVVVPGTGAAIVDSTGDVVQMSTFDGRISIHSGETVVEASSDDSPQWQPIRFLAGDAHACSIRLGLDDLDPYRHGHHAPPSPRLSADEIDRWRALFVDAWEMLAGSVPDRATEIATGLRTLVPLLASGRDSALSATISHAFGVFGLTRPPSAVEFAVTLVHEFQHSKLSAILDLVPLTDPTDERRFFAPWRVDPRPLAGLLQGVYAFVGVADTWRALRGVDAVGELAETQFAEARLQVDRGLTAVERSGALTPAGEALVAQLRGATDTMLAEPLPPRVTVAAEEALRRTHEKWLVRNDQGG